MGRLYLSLVDPCRREVEDHQAGQIQRCDHGYVMAAQQKFQDLPHGSSFAQAADSNPRWQNQAVAAAVDREVEEMAQKQVMTGKLGKILSGIVKAAAAEEPIE